MWKLEQFSDMSLNNVIYFYFFSLIENVKLSQMLSNVPYMYESWMFKVSFYSVHWVRTYVQKLKNDFHIIMHFDNDFS